MSEFVLGQGPGHKLEMAIGRNGGSLEDVEWLSSGGNFAKVTLLRTGKVELAMKPEPVITTVFADPIIHVDRSVRPVYPDWVKEVMHPELENTGPAEYDGSKLKQWLHPDQKNVVRGDTIYEYLKDKKLLSGCLSLRDLEEIQKKGITLFRQNFQGKVVFAWKSGVRNRNGNLCVPYLCEGGDEVVLDWYWLDSNWDANNPALRFAS